MNYLWMAWSYCWAGEERNDCSRTKGERRNTWTLKAKAWWLILMATSLNKQWTSSDVIRGYGSSLLLFRLKGVGRIRVKTSKGDLNVIVSVHLLSFNDNNKAKIDVTNDITLIIPIVVFFIWIQIKILDTFLDFVQAIVFYVILPTKHNYNLICAWAAHF